MATKARDGVVIRPLTAARVEDVRTVTRGTWGSQCWDLFPRYTLAQERRLGIVGGGKQRTGPHGLRRSGAGGMDLAGPRLDFSRIDASRATPRVDDVEAWVIPASRCAVATAVAASRSP